MKDRDIFYCLSPGLHGNSYHINKWKLGNVLLNFLIINIIYKYFVVFMETVGNVSKGNLETFRFLWFP